MKSTGLSNFISNGCLWLTIVSAKQIASFQHLHKLEECTISPVLQEGE